MWRTTEVISIIVPVYKAENYIADTIRTVVQQTYTDWELLLVDDKSPDHSCEVIEKTLEDLPGETAARIHLIRKEKNEGAARARNTGVDAAKGRYIAFLDADDLWDPRKLELSLSYMEKYHAGFVFTSYYFGDENAHPTGKRTRVPRTLTYEKALSRTVIFTSTVLIDTDIVAKNAVSRPMAWIPRLRSTGDLPRVSRATRELPSSASGTCTGTSRASRRRAVPGIWCSGPSVQPSAGRLTTQSSITWSPSSALSPFGSASWA